MNKEEFGKGCIPTPPEIKQNHYILRSLTPKIIDWNKQPREINLILRNQGSSSSCTGQATAYYCELLNQQSKERYSARHIYSQVALPNGGAYIGEAMKIPLKGLASQESVPDGLTEEIMTDKSLNDKAVIDVRSDKFAQIPTKDINYFAQIIDTYGGFVGGFSGNNSIVQTPYLQIPDHIDWGHAILIVDYLIINGIKYLKFLNSWDNWGDKGFGYISEEFVKSQYFFDAYTYAAIEDIEFMKLIKKQNDEDVYYIDDEGKRVQIGDYNTYEAFKGRLFGELSEAEVLTDEEFFKILKGGVLIKTKSV